MSNTTVDAAAIAAGRMAEFNVATETIALAGASNMVNGQNSKETQPWSYWRAPENAYITVMPSWPTEASINYDRGFVELKREFGTFYPRNKDGWDINREPYRRIFQIKGGADVFPVEQILELGWHRKPPYTGVSFSQIEQLGPGKWRILVGGRTGELVEDVTCPTCNKLFLSRANLVSHETIAHKETRANAELARAIGDGQANALTQMGGGMTDAIKALTDGQQQLAAALAQQGQVLAALLSERSGGKAKAA